MNSPACLPPTACIWLLYPFICNKMYLFKGLNNPAPTFTNVQNVRVDPMAAEVICPYRACLQSKKAVIVPSLLLGFSSVVTAGDEGV